MVKLERFEVRAPALSVPLIVAVTNREIRVEAGTVTIGEEHGELASFVWRHAVADYPRRIEGFIERIGDGLAVRAYEVRPGALPAHEGRPLFRLFATRTRPGLDLRASTLQVWGTRFPPPPQPAPSS